MAVEIWSSEAEYKAKYKTQTESLTVKQANGKFVTLLNANKKPEIDAIIATFKLIP